MKLCFEDLLEILDSPYVADDSEKITSAALRLRSYLTDENKKRSIAASSLYAARQACEVRLTSCEESPARLALQLLWKALRGSPLYVQSSIECLDTRDIDGPVDSVRWGSFARPESAHQVGDTECSMVLDNCTVPTGLASLSWSSVGSTERFLNSSEERPRPCQGSGSAKRARYAHAPGDSPSEMELDAEPNDNMDIDVDCVGGLPESHTTMELDSDIGMAPPPNGSRLRLWHGTAPNGSEP